MIMGRPVWASGDDAVRPAPRSRCHYYAMEFRKTDDEGALNAWKNPCCMIGYLVLRRMDECVNF